MRIDVKVRPPGSFIIITDDIDAEIPEFDARSTRIWWNEWCIGLGTRADVDGETSLHVGDRKLINPSGELIFDGYIKTPNKNITVSDADLVEYGAFPVSNSCSHIIVWTNHPREPDEIFIAIE